MMDGIPPEIQKVVEAMQKSFEKAMEKVEKDDRDDDKNCVQVGKLEGPMLMKAKAYRMDVDKLSQQQKVLMAKAEAIESRKKLLHSKFWDNVYSSLGISPMGHYKVTTDWRILKELDDKE